VDIDLNQLSKIIRGYRFRFQSEADLQDGVGRVLEQEKIPFERERPLGKDRVDYFADGIAIEIKVDGSLSQVTRQLYRYSEYPEVRALLLVTCKMQHDRMPDEMNGKEVWVAVVSSGGL
jgi:hypothetical protein